LGDQPAAKAARLIQADEKGFVAVLENAHISNGLPKQRFLAAPDVLISESFANFLIFVTAETASDIVNFPSLIIPAGIEKFLS